MLRERRSGTDRFTFFYTCTCLLSTGDIKGQRHSQSKWWIPPIDVSLFIKCIDTGLNTITWKALDIRVSAVPFDCCIGLRILWHEKGSRYRCLPLKCPCVYRAVFNFKGSGCRRQVSISRAIFKRSWRPFISGPLIVLECPSSPGQISFRARWSSHEKLLSGLFALPRCDGVHWFPLCPRHCVIHWRLHVDSLSYSTTGTDSLAYTSS